MKNKYILNQEKALQILFFNQHAVSLPALGLLVILIKMNCEITFENWMDEFGGGWDGWHERLFAELVKIGVLVRLNNGND